MTHLLIVQFAELLFDGVNELYLSGSEADQQHDTVRERCERVEVMAGGKRPLVHTLVYWLC